MTTLTVTPTGTIATPDLAHLIAATFDGWLAELHRKSVKDYRSDLAHLARWAATQGAPITANPPDRVAALVWLLGRGQAAAHADARRWLATMNTPATRARRRSCLRSLARHLTAAGLLAWPLELTTRATSDRVTANPDARPTVSADVVAALWHATTNRPRDRAVLALLVYAGLRRFEICELDIHLLDLPAGRARIRRKHAGESLTTVELAGPVVVALHAHITAAAIVSGPVFTAASGPGAGGRLQPDAINGILARVCVRAGAPRVKPHSLRHHGATLLAADGADSAEIQAWLGHASPEAAGSYIQAAGRRARGRAAAARIETLIPVDQPGVHP